MSAIQPTLLGLDIGGTKTACLEGDRDGAILQRTELPTEAARPFTATLPLFIDELRHQRALAVAAGRQPVALSVSVGGPLRLREGLLLDPPHLPGWHGAALRSNLQQAFPDLHVCIEHDGNAGALAELRFGAGRTRNGVRHLVFLTFGTGIGAGFIINGEVLHGATDTAGEIGHWRLSRGGPTGFGKQGSWEGFSSGAGLVSLASLRYPARWHADTPIRELVDAMLADDPDALVIADEAGRRLGQGLALLVDALNPEMIVLGSLAVVLGERVLAPARRVVAEEALPQAAAACAIVPAGLGRRIGDVAALMAGISDSRVARLLAGERAAGGPA